MRTAHNAWRRLIPRSARLLCGFSLSSAIPKRFSHGVKDAFADRGDYNPARCLQERLFSSAVSQPVVRNPG
jgi:hypothetical protein